MGEEIGMIDPDFAHIEEYVDVESLNAYQEMISQSLSKEEAFRRIKAQSRDNSRTPMQWTNGTQAGFTTGKPWLALAAKHEEINVENERSSKQSILAYYKKLIQLRKQYPVIASGNYQAYQPNHPQVYSFLRQLEKEKLLVLTNFYENETTITIPEEFVGAKRLIDNYSDTVIEEELKLKPYQAIALLIQ